MRFLTLALAAATVAAITPVTGAVAHLLGEVARALSVAA